MSKTLQECLKKIEDLRASRAIEHKLTDILMISILAVLCNADTWNDIADWGKARVEWLSTFLELPNGILSQDTFNRIFSAIDSKQFHEVFIEWVRGITDQIEGVVAIDGKTLRRSKDNSRGKKAIHVVSAWAVENAVVLGQRKIDEKSNEITAIPELLKQLEIKGCIVTIDAMGTQTKIAKTIISKDADYILSLKGNQQTSYDDVALYFKEEILSKSKKELEKRNQYYREINNEHGRLEIREYYVETEISWLTQRSEWEKLNGVAVCVSTVTKNDESTVSFNYGIFSREGMSAKEYGNARRSHWGIENSLHWCLDIAYREDESRARNENAAENLNSIRHMTLNMLKQEKTCKRGLAGKRKNCAWNDDYLLKVLNITA